MKQDIHKFLMDSGFRYVKRDEIDNPGLNEVIMYLDNDDKERVEYWVR